MEWLTRFSLDRPRAALLLLALLTAALGAGALRLGTDVGYRSLLGHDHPAVARFDALLEDFGGGFPLAAVFDCAETPRCESVFDADALETTAAVARALADEPAIRHVASPGTSPLLVPDAAAGIAVRHLVEDGRAVADRETLAERALRDSLWPRSLVDAEGRVGAIVIDVASSESADQVAAYAALDAALDGPEARGYRFHRVGGPVEFVVAGGELQADTGRMVPLMVVLIGCVLVLLFRSFAIAVAALVTVGLSVAWTFGAMGWLGWPQNSVTQALPPLLLVIGVCDVIHLLARLASDAAASPDVPRRALVLGAAREVGPPCVITSLTTAAGFASFATSGLESFVRFGLAAAFGVGAALVLTFTLLPLLVVRLPLAHAPAAAAAAFWDRALRVAVDGARRRARPLLAATLALALGLGWGAQSLRVDASFEDLYGEDSAVVRWAHFVGDHLRRPDTLEVVITAPADVAILGPDALRVLERAAASLDEIDGLGPARSVADPIALVNQLANDDEPFWRRVPGRADEVDAIVAEIGARDADALARWADPATRRARISLESEKLPQEEMRRVLAEVDTRLADILPAGWTHAETGPFAVVHEMIDEIQATQLWSFATAAGVVFALVAFFLRSLRLAALALVPTLLPVVATLGAMGWRGVPLDVGSAMVAAIVIGIAVDDCIHLLTVYQRLRGLGDAPGIAMRGAVMRVGRAVVTTSIALALGFFALTLSSWSTISHFGALTAVAMIAALVAVVAVLPAWMSLFGATDTEWTQGRQPGVEAAR